MTTINDVAHRAGVTPATVSNVLTGRVAVREKTRTCVLKAIEELHYRPNLVARSLAQGKTYTIGLIVPTITNPFFAEVAEEVERIADQHDYQLMLSTTYSSLEQSRRHLERMSSRWVDGFIVMSMAADITDVLAVAARGRPVVLCAWDEDARAQSFPHIDIDFRYAGELATRYLLESGHHQIAIIFEELVQIPRLEGYQFSLLAANLPITPEYIQIGDSTFESGYRATLALLTLAVPPTAIFAGNDMMAMGAIAAINERGLTVPGDMSVIGVDDITMAAHAHPPLTTISVPKRKMARMATELLLRRIDAVGVREDAVKMLIRPHLIIRQSTATSATLSRHQNHQTDV